jgi:hypothetical protein
MERELACMFNLHEILRHLAICESVRFVVTRLHRAITAAVSERAEALVRWSFSPLFGWAKPLRQGLTMVATIALGGVIYKMRHSLSVAVK